MSRADGPERGRKTEGLRSRPVLSPRRREVARREQAKRDKTRTRGRCGCSGPAFFFFFLRGPDRAQRSGSVGERRSKGAEGGMPKPGRSDWSGLCDDEVAQYLGADPAQYHTAGGKIMSSSAITAQICEWSGERREDGRGLSTMVAE